MNTDILIINGSPRKNKNCFKISEEISNKLNQNNISKYKNSNNVDKEEILKKILVGNIISMSKGLDYTVKEKIHCWINLKEKEVIMLRFYKEKTQSQVAKILGITQVQVSRIERRILNSMKLKLTS